MISTTYLPIVTLLVTYLVYYLFITTIIVIIFFYHGRLFTSGRRFYAVVRWKTAGYRIVAYELESMHTDQFHPGS